MLGLRPPVSSINARQFGQDITNVHKKNIPQANKNVLFGDRSMPLNHQVQNEVPFEEQIFTFLKTKENKYVPNQDYMCMVQDDITERMRSILVDWLVDVHLKFKLLPNTLFLTVNVIDRYLSAEKMSRKKLQLLGVSAMLIACKFEEIYAPEVRDFVYISDEAYSKEEILEIEGKILYAVKWDLCFTSPLTYLHHYYKLNTDYFGEEDIIFNLALYFIELSLISFSMNKFDKNLLAAASLYLSNKFRRSRAAWNEDLEKASGFKEADLRQCAKEICMCIKNFTKNDKLRAIQKKYASSKYMKVSTLPEFGFSDPEAADPPQKLSSTTTHPIPQIKGP